MKSSSLGLAAVLMLTAACDDDDTKKKPDEPADSTPVVVTNGDQTVSEGSLVTLDGANSYDADDNISGYAWTQSAGPDVTLGGESGSVATFSAPDVGDTTIFRFTLTVSDATGLSASSTVVVTVIDLNAAPIVNAGDDQMVDALTVISLAGAATDSDGSVTTYLWTQVGGPDAGDITNPDQANATVTAPDVDQELDLVFELTVADNEDKAASAAVHITVAPVIDSIAFFQQPSAPPQRNTIWGQVSVNILNSSGARIVSGDASMLDITLTAALENTTDVTADVAGTLTSAAESGRAYFRDLSFPYVTDDGNGIILTATATGVAPVTSQVIPVVWPSLLPGGVLPEFFIEFTDAMFVSGDLLVAGRFMGTDVDFDLAGTGLAENTLTSTSADGFIARYASDGSIVWVEAITSTMNVDLAAITVTADAIFVAVGYTGAQVTFPHDTDPVTLPATGGDDVAVAKLSLDGITEWAGAFQGVGDEIAYAIAVDGLGTPVVAGAFTGIDTDFDPDAVDTALATSDGGNQDAFVVKLDATGDYLWHTVLGAGPDDAATGIGHQASSGDVLVTGTFDSDAFFTRLDDADGAEKLTTGIIGGASGSDRAMPSVLEEGASNSVFIAGTFEGTVDFDPDDVDVFELTSTSGTTEVFVARFNAAGEFSWATRLLADSGISIDGLEVRSGDLLIAGGASGAVDFDPEGEGALSNHAGLTGYIATLSQSTGAFGWAKFWDHSAESGLGAVASSSSRILVCGTTDASGPIDLDPDDTVVNFEVVGSAGAFLVKLDADGAVVP